MREPLRTIQSVGLALEYIVCVGNEVARLNHAVSSSLAKWRVERTVRVAVSLEIKSDKLVFFHALTFVWKVCTLVPCWLYVLGGSSFFFGSD